MNLYNDDCFNIFETLTDNSIDMILTDPPYGISGLEPNNWKFDFVSNSHIAHIPMGMKFKSGEDFQAFMKNVSKECLRVLKPGGVMLCFSFPRLYHHLAIAMESSGLEIRDSLLWVYGRSQPKAFSQSHIIRKDPNLDQALITQIEHLKTPQLKNNYEIIAMGVKPKEGRYIDNYLAYGVGLMDTSVKTANGKFPSNVITTENISDEMDNLFFIERDKRTNENTHPTVKPVSLCEHLIKLFTRTDSVVLDPFMGSGTTGVACKASNRRFKGCEINKEYYEIAKRRIDEQLL